MDDDLTSATKHLHNLANDLHNLANDLGFQVRQGYPPSQIHTTVTQLILAEKSYRIAWRNAHEATG
jgi:hypothetical protein